MSVSWVLTLFFSLSWHWLPWGLFLHGSTRKALEPGSLSQCARCLCVGEYVAVWSCGFIHWDCSLLCLIYPYCDGIPTVNSCHLIQAADKNNKVDPKVQLQLLHVESNGIPQTNSSLPQHTDPVLHKSICRLTSSRWLYYNSETVEQTGGQTFREKKDRSCSN